MTGGNVVGAAARLDEADELVRERLPSGQFGWFRAQHAGSEAASTPLPSPSAGEVVAPAPAPRTEHAALIGLWHLAGEQLAELRALTARASAGESRSSASVKDSTRGVDLEVKSYADGLLAGAIEDAVVGYARGRRRLRELQDNAWAESLEQSGPVQ